MPEFIFPSDFDSDRVDWTSHEHLDNKLGVDPVRPDYVVRRTSLYSEWLWSPRTRRWRANPEDHEASLDYQQALARTALAEVEISLIEEAGIAVPARSTYQAQLVGNRAVVYNYVRRLDGDEFDPVNASHLPFVLPYAKAVLSYFDAKKHRAPCLADALLARNLTVGTERGSQDLTPRLYLHDLDPHIEPKILRLPDHRNRAASSRTDYAAVLEDLTGTLIQAPFRRRHEAVEATRLVERIATILAVN